MELFLEKVSKIMTADVVVLSPSDTVGRALRTMQDNDISVIPVVSGRRIMGIVSRLSLLESRVFPNTRVGTVARPAPSLAVGDSILDAARALTSHNVEAIPVLDAGRLLAGIVARYDVVKYALETGWLGKFRVRDVMSTDLVVARPSDSIGRVRKLLTKHAIRQVPVVEGGRLVGIVTIRDILEKVYSIELRRSTVGELAGSTESIFSRPVRAIMSRPVFSVEAADPLSRAGEVMVERGFFSTPVLEGRSVVGIVTRGDIVRMVSALAPVGQLPLSFKGLENLPPDLVELVNIKVSKTFERIARTVDLFEGRVVVGRRREGGVRSLYIFDVSARTARGVVVASERGWEPAQVLTRALKSLERQCERVLTRKREGKRRPR